MPAAEALGLAFLVVLAVFVMLSVGYLSIASSFNDVRHPRNEFAFHLGTSVWIVAGIAMVGSAAILQTRTWFIATILMVVLSLVFVPVVAYSGPGYLLDAVSPLLALKSFFGPVLVIACARIAYGIAARRA